MMQPYDPGPRVFNQGSAGKSPGVVEFDMKHSEVIDLENYYVQNLHGAV